MVSYKKINQNLLAKIKQIQHEAIVLEKSKLRKEEIIELFQKESNRLKFQLPIYLNFKNRIMVTITKMQYSFSHFGEGKTVYEANNRHIRKREVKRRNDIQVHYQGSHLLSLFGLGSVMALGQMQEYLDEIEKQLLEYEPIFEGFEISGFSDLSMSIYQPISEFQDKHGLEFNFIKELAIEMKVGIFEKENFANLKNCEHRKIYYTFTEDRVKMYEAHDSEAFKQIDYFVNNENFDQAKCASCGRHFSREIMENIEDGTMDITDLKTLTFEIMENQEKVNAFIEECYEKKQTKQ